MVKGIALDRVATGIHGLDELIRGGVPRGSLVLLAGPPGSGKTNFAAEFLYKGAQLGERGIYVSFAEGRDAFFANARGFGWDFPKLEKEGKFKFIDLATTREAGIAETIELILDQVRSTKADRLVIDSYTALATAFGDAIDSRIVMHTIMGKMTRRERCTTILVSEAPRGGGAGQEEFVADGIIRLAGDDYQGRFVRSMYIEKMRGTELYRKDFAFTLHGGFRVLPTPEVVIPETPSPYEAIPDMDGHHSTGVRDLDAILGGGFPKKSVVLYEVIGRIGFIGTSYLLQWLNAICQGRGAIILPREGMDSYQVRELITRYVDEKTFRKFARIVEKTEMGEEEDYTVGISGKPDEDIQAWRGAVEELKRVTNDQAVLWWVGVDRMEHMYDHGELMRLLSDLQVVAQRNGDLTIRRATTEGRSCKMLSHMSSVHLTFANPHDSHMLVGVKPLFAPHYFQPDFSKGYPQLHLIPVT